MPSTKYPCYLEFSDSGSIARLVHKNGAVLAELLIHGSFAARTDKLHRHVCVCGHGSNEHIAHTVSGAPWFGKCLVGHDRTGTCNCIGYMEAEHASFQAEVWGLANYEILDLTSEKVKEIA